MNNLSYAVFKEPEATSYPHATKVFRILPDGVGVKAEKLSHLLSVQGGAQFVFQVLQARGWKPVNSVFLPAINCNTRQCWITAARRAKVPRKIKLSPAGLRPGQ
jgi:hypothetical protein